MSIDANVVGISRLASGDARLTLDQPNRSRCAGQDSLTVVDPPPNLEILLDRAVWGGADTLMCGEIKVGERVGYTGLRVDAAALDKVKKAGAT